MSCLLKCCGSFWRQQHQKKKDWHNNQYWMSELPKTTKGKLKCAQQFQQDAIKMKPPQDWDMSVLAFAIQNHPNLLKDVQKDDVTKMKDKRNVQCHKNPATYEKEEFDKLFIDFGWLIQESTGRTRGTMC